MPRSVSTHLMFVGVAEEALNLYTSTFSGAKVTHIERVGVGEPGTEGAMKRASFTICGQNLIILNSPIKHEFTFTPSMSLFVECEDEAELQKVFARLSEGGTVLMPLDSYGFSTKFAWFNDRFGVSWQLNLP